MIPCTGQFCGSRDSLGVLPRHTLLTKCCPNEASAHSSAYIFNSGYIFNTAVHAEIHG